MSEDILAAAWTRCVSWSCAKCVGASEAAYLCRAYSPAAAQSTLTPCPASPGGPSQRQYLWATLESICE